MIIIIIIDIVLTSFSPLVFLVRLFFPLDFIQRLYFYSFSGNPMYAPGDCIIFLICVWDL